MKRIFTLMVMLCFLVQYAAKAQINGQQPGTALSICDASSLSIGTVPGYNGGGLPNSCLAAGALNPYWYTFTVTTSGTIGFTITPNNSSDDYDFAVYDISNTQPSNAANAPLVSCNYSGYTGTTGCTPSGSGSSNGANGSNENQLINVTAGQTLALVVSHYTSSNQSGYDLQFTGGTVAPSPLPPAMDTAYVSNCNEKLNVTFNQSVECSSIAANGSDFYLMPGNIAISAASGVGCGSTTFTNKAILTLPSNIATGNYTLHVKNGSDGNTITDVCSNNIPTSNTVAFTVSPAPAPNANFTITSADTQCQYNNSFSFNNTSTVSLGTMTYAWAFGDNGSATFTSGSHSYGSADNFTVKLTVTTNQGCIDSTNDTVTVVASPGAPAKVSPVNYCINQTPVAVSATPSANSTLNWYSTPTSTTASSTAPIPSTAVVGTYTFYVSQTLTTTGCEGPRDSIKVIVKPLPAALTAGSNTPVCSKDTVKLTGGSSSASVTYAWTGPNGFTSSSQNPTVDSATMAAAGTYKVVVTLNGCKDSTTTVVVMNQTPYNITASSNTPVCSDALNVLHLLGGSSNAAATYSWTGPNGYTSNVQNPNISPVAMNMAGTYQVTATANGCSDTMSTVVAINQTPVGLTASNSGPVCSGPTKSVQLSANTTTTGTPTYSWTGPNGYTSNQQNPTITGLTVANSGKYICTVTLGTCSDTVSTIVTIKQTPVGLVATSNSPLCSGAATNINLNATTTTSGTITYGWTGPNTFTSNIQAPTINGATVAMVGRYIATVTMNGCSDTVGVNVAIGQTPVGLTASSNSPVCSGPNKTITLQANTTTPGAITYSWSGPNSYTSNSQTPSISGATVAMSGKYTATITLNGCSDTVSTIVTVKQTPVGLTASSNSPICSGTANNINLQSATTTPGAITYSWAGPSAYTSNVQNPVINAAATNMSGKYIATIALNGCSDTVSTMVTVNQTPAAPVAVDTVWYCNNSTATALSATGTNLKWYTSIGGTASTTAPTPSTATVGNTTYYVSQTSAAGCEGPVDSILVIIKPNPARPTVTTPVVYCLNDVPVALIATAATGGALNWYTSVGGIASGTAPIPSTATATSYKWYVSQTVNGCEGAVDSIQVTVKPLPAPPTVGSNTPVCSGTGNTLNLTSSSVTSGVTYGWTGPNSYTSSSQNPSITAPTLAASGNYVVTVTLNGCIRKDSTTVLINPTPVAPTVVPTLAYCQYLPTVALTATAVTGNTVKWYTSNTSTTPLAGAPTPSSLVPGTYTWYVSQTSPQGCEGPRASIAVTIKPKPTLPGVAPLYTYCQFENVPALTANGQNLLWYSGVTGGLGSPTAPIPSTLVPTLTTFFVSQTINGCEGDRDSIKVKVLPKPAPPIVVTPISYCQYSTAQPLTATGTNLKWYTTATGGVGAAAGPVPNTGYEDTISYYVSQTVNGCESDRMRLDVIVNYQPNGIITATSANICQYSLDTFNYFGNARPDALYDWKSLFQKSTLISGSGQGPIVVRFDSVGAITVQMQVENKGCVSTLAVSTVNVAPAPVVRITAKDDACQDEAVVVAMNYASIPVTKFNWSLDGGQVEWGADAGPLGVIWKTPGKHVVTLTATTDSKCTSLPTIDTVDVHPLPDVRILSASKTDVCLGDSVLLRASLPDSGTVYTWSPVTQFGGLTQPGTQDVYAKVLTSGHIKLTGTNEWGCKAADSIMIVAASCCQIYFPDAFTPNKDGKNDLFRPITNGHHEIATFRVVNRYGQVVFETVDEQRGWDGTFGGSDQPMDTYSYYIKYKCEGKYIEEKGQITLIR